MLQLGIPRPSEHRNFRDALRIREPPSLQITEYQPPIDLRTFRRQSQGLLEIPCRPGEVARIQRALSLAH